MELIKIRLLNAFRLTSDLLDSFSEKDLKSKIPNVPSNTIGGQFWCIVGARESYMKAIQNKGEWQGFSCGITDAHAKNNVKSMLKKTMKDLESLEIDWKNKKVAEQVIVLLEHEVQHHGQLIRYIYSNKLKFPKSWNQRYTV